MHVRTPSIYPLTLISFIYRTIIKSDEGIMVEYKSRNLFPFYKKTELTNETDKKEKRDGEYYITTILAYKPAKIALHA